MKQVGAFRKMFQPGRVCTAHHGFLGGFAPWREDKISGE
jgi:hypothetical protein